nr:hypothetical protein [Devosia soli]
MSKFLKCDAEGCDHIEDVAEITGDMIGKPCPKCGSDLLTLEDFEFYTNLMKPSMALMTELGLSRPATSDDPDHLRMRISGHKGELHMKFPSIPSNKRQ